MSFSTTYLTPTSIERDLELTRATTHQRSSGSIYTEDMYLAQKMESDPREFYVDENRDLAHESGTYMMDAEPGAKQPRDRMRLNRILNNGTQVAEEYPQQEPQDGAEYQGYPYQDNSIQSFQPVGMPVSTFSSSMPVPVPVPSLPTMTTVASSMSPSTSFAMAPPGVIFDGVMPYSYDGQYPQTYPFKHAGNAKSMDHPTFAVDAAPGYSPQGHHYQHSPDPSSPSVMSAFPQRVDHSHGTPDSPPSFYQGQYHAHSPYSIGSHSPTAGYPPYVASNAPGYNSLTPTPPATPHYGLAHTPDGRYGPSVPMYGDYFNMTTAPMAGPRSNNRYLGTPSTPPTPTPTRARKAPYQRSAKTDLAGNPAPRRFQCNECEKAFPTKGELASHSRCHLKVPAFLCGICGRPFKRRTDYVRHVRNVHEEVGRYSCAQCGERFGRLDKLKRHDKRGCGADPEDDDK
ncbi:hypothetical protein CPC16_003602 [Podila verticillata]|nr:hypothetical protein BGZ52_008633 [Haplosporangium bisporale]KAF9217916.1 hypothetical protein BGZ59_008044 [Podila verticillata]KAF9396257.1 hypothetical protein CPC16_003602 [Podila verticillata]KFH67160.1 hypothetical protein MVEG_07683 [Podila verticillata NRRL 6337]